MCHCTLTGSIMKGYTVEDGRPCVNLNCFSKDNWANQDIPDCCEFKAEYCIKEWNGKENENG